MKLLAEAYLACATIALLYAWVICSKAQERAAAAGARHYVISVVFAWYDMWCGVYYDRKCHKVYIFPVPMMGVCVEFNYIEGED